MMRILIIESNNRSRAVLERQLASTCSGAVIDARKDWNSEVDGGLTKTAFELLVVDFQTLKLSAGGSVKDALHWLRLRVRKGIPPVVILANPSSELLAVACIKAGAANYLPKSLSGKLLSKIVKATGKKNGVTRLAQPPPSAVRAPARSTLRPVAVSAPAVSLPQAATIITPTPIPAPPDSEECSTVEHPQIDGYRIINHLGDGGMASVFAAYSEELGHNVVLKVHPVGDDSALSRGLFDRFQREYRIISRINSREIVEIFDFGVLSDKAYIAMEYFPGGDLQARLLNPITVHDAASYARQIARALQVIHDLGIFHRDLKPGNVMLREDSSLTLIDFGVAKTAVAATIMATLPGMSFGTPHYASPEQALGKEVDVRSDLYSLGVIFYEMLTGRKLFRGKSAMAILHAHCHTPAPALDKNQEYQPVLDRLLAKAPADRFQSAGEVLAALSEIN